MTGTPNGTLGLTSRPRLFLVGIVFLVTRLAVLSFQPPASDVGIYARYAQEYESARRQGTSFYEFHAQVVQQQIDKARETGNLQESMEEYKNVEYPPLALAFMRLPKLILGWHWQPVASRMPGDGGPPLAFLKAYRFAFRSGIAAVDLLLTALFFWLVRGLFATENSKERSLRLLAYVVTSAVLWPFLYDRLDLLLAAMVILALLLLYTRLHYAWSFAMLAVAINFKVVPLVLAPVWIVGSLRPDVCHWRLAAIATRLLAALGIRGAFLASMIIVCFLPFYVSDGKRSLDFLVYHQARGLEFESFYSSLLLALRPWGQVLEVRYSYGSINFQGSLSGFLVALAPWLMLSLFLAATSLLLTHGMHLSTVRGTHPWLSGVVSCAHPTALAGPVAEEKASRVGNLAQIDPQAFAAYVLLFFMLFIASNKVFSPQYLLWLAPLVALVPFRGRGCQLFLGSFLLIAMLTTLVVPFLLFTDLVEDSSSPQVSMWIFKEPTLRLATILIIRNLLFLVLLASLAVYLFRRARRPPPLCVSPLF